MTAAALVRELADAGIRLASHGNHLRVTAAPGTLTPERRALLVAHKAELLAELQTAAARFRARWRDAALVAGVSADSIVRMPPAALELYRLHFDDCPDWYAAAPAAARMLADDAERRAGRVPEGDTAVIACRGCGLVYVHPSIARVLPVVGGWPRALGCPWCFIRAVGGYIPRPSVAPADCAHWTPDTVNPGGGRGQCQCGSWWPNQRHTCKDFRPKEPKL